MKKISMGVVLCALSFHVLAEIPGLSTQNGIISWNETSGWMQVQRSVTYETICEGRLATCETGEGIFQVIDHTNNLKQLGIVVENELGSGPEIAMVEYVRETCGPNLNDSLSSCLAVCPQPDKKLLGVVTCQASGNAGRLPTSFGRQIITPPAGYTPESYFELDSVFCESSHVALGLQRPDSITVEIACLTTDS